MRRAWGRRWRGWGRIWGCATRSGPRTAPRPGPIHIALERLGAGIAFTVSNPAGNLEAEDVAQLFDPFWRKEAARSGGQHVGLGLSLALTFARAMGWTLSATLDGQRHLVLRLATPS